MKNTGQIVKTRSQLPYTQVPNEMLQREDMSVAAKGLLCYLLSLPSDWVVYKTELHAHFKNGKHSISSAFEECIELGYIVAIEQFNGNLKAGYNYVVYSTPCLPDNKESQFSDFQKSEIRFSDFRKSDTTNKHSTKETDTKETSIGAKKKKEFVAPSIEDVEFYFVSNGYTKAAAHRAWNYYNAGGWKDSSGKPVINWKQKMIAVWFKDENKDGTTSFRGA